MNDADCIAATYNGSGRNILLVPQNQIHTYFMVQTLRTSSAQTSDLQVT